MPSLVQSRFLLLTSVGSLALAGVISACSSSSNPSGSPDSGNEGDGGASSSGSSSGGGSSSSSGAGPSSSGGSGSSSSGGASSSGGPTDGGCPTIQGTASYAITVYNFDNWCTVGINGAATSVSSSYQACVPSGNPAQIVVGPASTSFELGPTPFVSFSDVEELDSGLRTTTGDGGFGSTSTVVVGITVGPGCVLVCCPFTDGSGCDSSFSGYSAFLSDCPH